MRNWPAYCAAGLTAAYGLLKAYWALGGTALWSIAPLPQSMIDKARSHTADSWFVVWALWATVALAVLGVLFALATVRSWGRVVPSWLILGPLWLISVLMVLRAVLVGISDVQRLTAVGDSTYTASWDLALWSPYFLVWGLLWAATAHAYTRRPTPAPNHRTPSDHRASSRSTTV